MKRRGYLIVSIAMSALAVGCSESNGPIQSPEVIVTTNAVFNVLVAKLPTLGKGSDDYWDRRDVKNHALCSAHADLYMIAKDERTNRFVRGMPPVEQWKLVAKWWQLMDCESKRLGIDRKILVFNYDAKIREIEHFIRIGKKLGRYTDKDITDICNFLEPYVGCCLKPDTEEK